MVHSLLRPRLDCLHCLLLLLISSGASIRLYSLLNRSGAIDATLILALLVVKDGVVCGATSTFACNAGVVPDCGGVQCPKRITVRPSACRTMVEDRGRDVGQRF
jgi:hypothetical protein